MKPGITSLSLRRLVLAAALALFGTWTLVHIRLLTGEQSGWIRFTLTVLLATAIIMRPKSFSEHLPSRPALTEIISAAMGTCLAIFGLVFGVGQLEWLGVLLLLWAALRWALPSHYSGDVNRGLLLLYWAHPLPALLFAPLQFAMQRLSVMGAECLLLGLDIDIWADRFSLHTGFRAYEIPAWCSGLRTATTVLLVGFGLGMLSRLKRFQLVVLLTIGLLQTLFLNIVRIGAMVVLVPRMTTPSDITFLHDSTALVLPLSIVLMAAEIVAWRLVRHARDQQSDAPAEVTEEIPPVWQRIRRYAWPVALALAVSVGTVIVLYRNGPQHRNDALRRVTDNAYEAQRFAESLYLVDRVLDRTPGHPEWQMTRVRILVLLHRYREALGDIGRIADIEDQSLRHTRTVFQAYALMALDRLSEAAPLVETLPASYRRRDPRVAMIMAELAFRVEDVDRLTEHLPSAARLAANSPRIRRMVPFLRRHHAWATIVATDDRKAYTHPIIAFAVMEAYMNLDRALDVARLVRPATRRWPRDGRILEPLYYLVLKRPGERWENLFAYHLRLIIAAASDVDPLYAYLAHCFDMGRPDLGWLIVERMKQIDASHPARAMAVVTYGDRWFTFRKHVFGIPTASPTEVIDMRMLYVLAGRVANWQAHRQLVPHGAVLSRADTAPVREAFLNVALRRFRRRLASGQGLSLPMHYLYASALEMDGRRAAANRYLATLSRTHPEAATTARIKRSELAERAGDWHTIYELLRTYPDTRPPHQLPALLRLVRAQRKLKLMLAAEFTSHRILHDFPLSSHARAERARILLECQAPGDALQILAREGPRHIRERDVLELEALIRTERFSQVEEFSRRTLLPRVPISEDTPQRLDLPPANRCLYWHNIATPTEADFAALATHHRSNLTSPGSPFMATLAPLWLRAYDTHVDEASADVPAWINAGRDPLEQATALHQLVLLLCREQRPVQARLVARRAVDIFAESPFLWRWMISLAEGDPATIADAHRHCPQDPEIWLAHLNQLADTAPGRLRREVTRVSAAAASRYAPETLARAAMLLLQRDQPAQAAMLARRATADARGLLPAYILGIRCAIAVQDRTWAMECTRNAIQAALRPPSSLFRKFIQIRASEPTIDTSYEMVDVLSNLIRDDPENLLWVETLGYVHFSRGGWEITDAMELMAQALEAGSSNELPYRVTAEVHRRLENNAQAIAYLRRGLQQYPGDIAMINNLAYVLARTPGGMREARRYLPVLLEHADENPNYIDTAADIYLRSGQTKEAIPLVRKLEQRVDPGTYLWFRARLHLSLLALRRGDLQQAFDILNTAVARTRLLPEEDMLEAKRMLARWEKHLAVEQQ